MGVTPPSTAREQILEIMNIVLFLNILLIFAPFQTSSKEDIGDKSIQLHFHLKEESNGSDNKEVEQVAEPLNDKNLDDYHESDDNSGPRYTYRDNLGNLISERSGQKGCIWQAWSSWRPCSGGWTSRTMHCVGDSPAIADEQKSCGNVISGRSGQNLISVCIWAAWSSWSGCRGGWSRRTRQCKGHPK